MPALEPPMIRNQKR